MVNRESSEYVMELLKPHLSKIRVPGNAQPIYKDECMYSFDNPESPSGLFVSLTSFLGFGEEYVQSYANKTENFVFLHIRREKILKSNADTDVDVDAEAGKGKPVLETEAGPERKITRLAIGLDGGYTDKNAKKYEYQDTYSIVVVPELNKKLPYPNNELPLIVSQSVDAMLAHESAISKLEKDAVTGTWDGEVRQISQYAENLVQLESGKKVPPSGWKCEKCELTNNLWLNLTDGSILCGRKFFDGSGGNDHAVEHYREFGFPLAVKLGTISSDGKSDVYSYPEDDMVLDPKLEQHLAHFGINMAAMKKSEKSMVELELEINQRIGEWSLLTESDSLLQPLAGPGYTGMRNMGNSCYINSVMQVLFNVPDFIKHYTGEGAEKFFAQFPSDPANDFNIQMAKLGNGLWSGKYSSISDNSLDSESQGIAPNMFKNIVGKNHPDFSTKLQQDAFDFLLHLFNLVERNLRDQFNPVNAFLFELEERVECLASSKVKYNRRDEYCMQLEIPLERATNLEEVKAYQERQNNAKAAEQRTDKNIVRHRVPLQACIERFFSAEVVEQFYSSAIGDITNAKKFTRMASMPDFLMLHLRKFTLGDDWAPRKLDVAMDMPDELDLSQWRATGLQPGEQKLPEQRASKFTFQQSVMNELLNMGFPIDACKRALFNTKNDGGVQAASNWLIEHYEDEDLFDPFIVPMDIIGDGVDKSNYVADPEDLGMLMTMGFEERAAVRALKETGGDIERATDWIFSHADAVDADEHIASPAGPEAAASADNNAKTYRDGEGKYKLVAFISHMGTSAQVGHYVCHILKDGQWVIFNDSKVAISQNPPKDLGYLYMYKRIN